MALCLSGAVCLCVCVCVCQCVCVSVCVSGCVLYLDVGWEGGYRDQKLADQ